MSIAYETNALEGCYVQLYWFKNEEGRNQKIDERDRKRII